MNENRLFIVSSRLPVCIDSANENPIRPASTKLVKAIQSHLYGCSKSFENIFWVGIPGCEPTRWNEATNQFFKSPYTYLPVLVFKEQYRKYHLGFAKPVIWQLFNGAPLEAVDAEAYEQYISVNERYAEVLEKKCWENDTVWINDYHLLLLPAMVRNKFPTLKIEYFLHVPFPPLELYQLLPENCQADILKGMMGADIIRFNSAADISNFQRAVEVVFGIINDQDVIRYKERLITVGLLGQGSHGALPHLR